MSLSDWFSFHSRYLALGGEVQNLVPGIGSRGRGLFAVDVDRPSGVFCPKQLLLNTQHLSFTQAGGIRIAESAGYSPDATSFFHDYYNDWSWHGGGRNEALSFLDGLRSLPIQIRARLIELRLLSPSLLNPALDEASLFQRFIFTRTASFEHSQMLAPVWDLVNHSAFAQPFLQCLGQHYSKGFNLYRSVTLDGETLTIPCMPIGSISATLPVATLADMLFPFGIADLAIRDFYRQLAEYNVEIRLSLLEQISSIETSHLSALREGLRLEQRLIARSIPV